MSRDSRPEACRSERSPPLIQRPPCHLALIPGTRTLFCSAEEPTRLSHTLKVIAVRPASQMTLNERLCSLGCRRDRDVGRDRSYIGQVGFWRFWFDWLKRIFVFDKFVEYALDRFSCLIRTGIAHVVV